MHNIKTKVINLMGGPGAGKTSSAMELAAHMKWNGIVAEYVSEYAKSVVWDERLKDFDNQIYIFSKQYKLMFRLLGKVDYIVTDSPLLLSMIYNQSHPDFNDFIFKEFNKFNNINIYLNRLKPYLKVGRYQEESEAKTIDDKVRKLLDEKKVPYRVLDGKEGIAKKIMHVVEVENFN
jgi:nicotinamide riboside kinase